MCVHLSVCMSVTLCVYACLCVCMHALGTNPEDVGSNPTWSKTFSVQNISLIAKI